MKRQFKKSRWISVRHAAEVLGVSHNTVRKEIREHRLAVLGYLDDRVAILDREYVEREAERRNRSREVAA